MGKNESEFNISHCLQANVWGKKYVKLYCLPQNKIPLTINNKSIPKIPVVNEIPPWLRKVPIANFELPGNNTKKNSEFPLQISALELISEIYVLPVLTWMQNCLL